jgi:hypothetical protein
MENSIDCTKMHGSSKRSILLLVEDWCSMRRDVSRANVGHLRWQRKMTEAPNIPKITAAIAQNEQIYSKKWSFALLLLTNPLSYTIRRIISMGVVAIGGLLSLTLGRQRVIIMVISMKFFLVKHDVMCSKITGNLKFKASVIF